ncbi:hypothetical protein BOX15_Mlig007141g1 [Macrostomum lignano]|uniref:Uncharacterized protein n=1 Tax=Macrostomum lignano TaxID=282301 RepID=A0A267GQ36_9PLAT|nr:hypothetical protein BOX15_Mlig007141g1 [Macrostomum lignano]
MMMADADTVEEVVDRYFVEDNIEARSKLKNSEKFFLMRECCWETVDAYEYCGMLVADLWVDQEVDTVFNLLEKFCLKIQHFQYEVDPHHCKLFYCERCLPNSNLVPRELLTGVRIYIVDFVLGRSFVLKIDSRAIQPELKRCSLGGVQLAEFYN